MVSLGSPVLLLSSLQNKLSSRVLLRGIKIGPENFPTLFKITVKGGKEWGFPSWNPPAGPCVHFFGYICEKAWFKSSHVCAGVLILSFASSHLPPSPRSSPPREPETQTPFPLLPLTWVPGLEVFWSEFLLPSLSEFRATEKWAQLCDVLPQKCL